MSEEFLNADPETNKGRRALVLIQGAGGVRAGIWARSACVKQNLEIGSMLPFLERCEALEIPVLVLNPNCNSDPRTNQTVFQNHTKVDHAVWVWEKYVKDSGFNQIHIVAHSAGGRCL